MPAAALYLKNRFADKAVWLNEDIRLNHIIIQKGYMSAPQRIDSLAWLPADSLVDGISYDAPASNIFALKRLLKRYNPLLIASGMNVVKSYSTNIVGEQLLDHPETILGKSLKEMRETECLCDMVIIIDGKKFSAHRVVLATFSSYFFSMLANGNWTESSDGIVNLDNPNQITEQTYGKTVERKYATKRSVAASVGLDL